MDADEHSFLRQKLQTPSSKHQAPNTKLQTPEKHQATSFRYQRRSKSQVPKQQPGGSFGLRNGAGAGKSAVPPRQTARRAEMAVRAAALLSWIAQSWSSALRRASA